MFKGVVNQIMITHPDEPEDPPDPEDPDDPEEGGRDGEVGHHVLHDDAHDGGDHQNKVEHVPPRREVHEAQADDLDDALFGRRRENSGCFGS